LPSLSGIARNVLDDIQTVFLLFVLFDLIHLREHTFARC
jgi:hypothetical protein